MTADGWPSILERRDSLYTPTRIETVVKPPSYLAGLKTASSQRQEVPPTPTYLRHYMDIIVSLDEPLLPASSLTRNTRNTSTEWHDFGLPSREYLVLLFIIQANGTILGFPAENT